MVDTNGVTIKARDWVTVGTTGDLNGVTYTAVDIETLRSIFSSYASNWTKDDAARKAAEEAKRKAEEARKRAEAARIARAKAEAARKKAERERKRRERLAKIA
ncbi:MAG: hypothetical protein QGG84_10610, partial [Rhodospirillales bacterium]|nr:hypothetical protein [Rhodospirillales bacterium]